MKWTKGVLLIVGIALSYVVLDSGISKINSQTGDSQTLVTGTAGTDFAISSSGNVHTFNMPTASGSNRGLVTTEDVQDFVGAMVDASIGYVDGTPLLQRAALTGAITATAGSNATVLGSFVIADLNTAVSDANLVTIGAVETITGAKTFQGNIDLDSDLLDKSGDAGTAGQYLTSLGSGAGSNWVTGYVVLAAGHPAESKTNSTASEQDYATIYTIPANLIIENKILRVTLGFEYVTGVSSVTLLHYVEVGGTKVYTSGATDLTSSVTRSASIVFTINGTAAAGASANVETMYMSNPMHAVATGTNTVDQPIALATNGTLTIVPGIQYSGTGSTETMVLRTYLIEQLN